MIKHYTGKYLTEGLEHDIIQDSGLDPGFLKGGGKEEYEKGSFIPFPLEPDYPGTFLLADACALAKGGRGPAREVCGPGRVGVSGKNREVLS